VRGSGARANAAARVGGFRTNVAVRGAGFRANAAARVGGARANVAVCGGGSRANDPGEDACQGPLRGPGVAPVWRYTLGMAFAPAWRYTLGMAFTPVWRYTFGISALLNSFVAIGRLLSNLGAEEGETYNELVTASSVFRFPHLLSTCDSCIQ